jgi:hypothetical protein
MAITVSHLFLGAISLGVAFFRGTEAYTGFHHESLVGQANYGASKLAQDHARSANVVVNDNVIMTAIMGPRFGVEADNITMDANAEMACPTCPKSPICTVCTQYKANKPRALAKLIWVRAKQQMLWGTLGKLSGDIDRLASMQAGSMVSGDLQRLDSRVKIRFEDPSQSQEIWGGNNADVACKLAMKDTLPSPVTGHAFPILITPNLLEGLPKALVQAMPQMICAATSALSGGSGGSGGPQLPEIRSVADQTRNDCRSLEDQMRCAIAAAGGSAGSCQSYPPAGDHEARSAPEVTDLPDVNGRVQFPSKVEAYVQCQTASPDAPLVNASAGGYSYRGANGQIVTCTFDRDKCQDKQLTENSSNYMRDKIGLPRIVSNLAAALGGSETRKPSAGGSNPENFCACSVTQRPIDDRVIQLSDAVRKISSFGSASPSEALRRQRDYRSCGRWYFPDRKGEFASTPQDEQPFVGAWKWSMVTKCPGGGGA